MAVSMFETGTMAVIAACVSISVLLSELRGSGRASQPDSRRASRVRASWASVYSAAGHGRPQAKDVQVAPRQAARHAQALLARAGGVPAVPSAEAASPRLPDLR